MNKLDQLPEYVGRGAEVRVDKDGVVDTVYLSAKTGEGLDLLRSVLAGRAKFTDKIKTQDIPFENEAIAVQVERPVTADYLGGLSSSIPSYSPRDV